MPERSSIAQVSQIGKETTPGTAVAATRRLGSLTFSPSLTPETNAFRPAGVKFPTVMTLNKEMAEVPYEGVPTFEEIIYPLAGVLGTPTVVQVMDGATPTGAYEWSFTPNSTDADVPLTFTLENGQSGVQAEKYAHLMLTGLSMAISRSEATLSGSGFAQAVTTGITPTAALALPAILTPIQPGQFTVYLSDTSAGLATPGNRLTRLISVAPSVEDRFTPAWFVNQVVQSFTTYVENADGVGGTIGLMVEADTAGLAWLTKLRAGTTHFLRIEAVGPVVYNAGAQPNLSQLFQWDAAFKVESTDSFSDEDGIYAIGWQLRPTHDVTWGKAMTVKVRNKIATL